MARKSGENKVVKRRRTLSQIGIVKEVAAAYGVRLPAEQLEPSLTPNQIGEILGVTGEAVKQWIYQRRLPAVKLANGYWQVKKADLERFLQVRYEGVKRRILAAGLDAETLRAFNAAMGGLNKYDLLSTDLLADALLKIYDLQPAMIIVDVSWPHGWELVERVRAKKGVRGIPILVLANAEEAADVERATKLEIKGFLTKPITAAALEQQITGIMSRHL